MHAGIVFGAALVAGCGRVNFDPLGGASNPGSLAWVDTFVQDNVNPAPSVTTFTAQALNAGDAIALHVACNTTASPTSVSVTAPGWSFVQLTTIAAAQTKYAVAFGAIAPDTTSATFTITWSTICSSMDVLGDEFANSDPAGGTTTFDAQTIVTGSSTCMPTVTTASMGEVVWAAASQSGTAVSVSADYTKTADDGHDDWAAYRLTTDPANTLEMVTFTSTGTACVATAVTIKPR